MDMIAAFFSWIPWWAWAVYGVGFAFVLFFGFASLAFNDGADEWLEAKLLAISLAWPFALLYLISIMAFDEWKFRRSVKHALELERLAREHPPMSEVGICSCAYCDYLRKRQ